GANLGDVLDDRNGDHRFGAGGAAVRDEIVAALAGGGARVADALEVPVLAAIVGVLLPVVTRCVVAAVAMEWCVQVLQLRGRGVRDPVDSLADGVAIGRGINGDGHRSLLGFENSNRSG